MLGPQVGPGKTAIYNRAGVLVLGTGRGSRKDGHETTGPQLHIGTIWEVQKINTNIDAWVSSSEVPI